MTPPDTAPLPEDVSMHTMQRMLDHHIDGRVCQRHARLGLWCTVIEGEWYECTRSHI